MAVRLVATPDAEGAIVGALEIQLEPGWKTYWRWPGDGGLPPVIDFSRSINLADVDIAFPPPHRYDDGYTITNVYEGTVLLPLTVTATMAAAPVMLQATLDIGVCDVVCIPVRLDASVTIFPGEVDATALAIADEARAFAPVAPHAGFEITGVTIQAVEGSIIRLRVEAELPQAFGAELFIEPPAGWIPHVPRQVENSGTHAAFEVTIERPAETTTISGTPIRMMAVSAGAAVEGWYRLP